MSIKAIFVTNSLPLSRLVSWGTRRKGQKIADVPSHVGFLFFDSIMIDSTLTSGVKESTYDKFKDKYRIVSVVDLDITESYTYRYLENARSRILGSGYDWIAITYYSYRVVLHKFFNIPIPKKNKMNVANNYFCTEVMQVITGTDYSIVSPNDLMIELTYENYKMVV